MPAFTIEEFEHDGNVGGFASEPASVVQTPITTSGTSQLSATFADDTRWVALSCSGAVRVAFGASPTASATTRYLPAGWHLLATRGGIKLAVIDAV